MSYGRGRMSDDEDTKALMDIGGPAYNPFSKQLDLGYALRNSVTMALAYEQWKKEQQQKELSANIENQLKMAQAKKALEPNFQDKEVDWALQHGTPEEIKTKFGMVKPKAGKEETPVEYGAVGAGEPPDELADILSETGLTWKQYEGLTDAQKVAIQMNHRKTSEFADTMRVKEEAINKKGGSSPKGLNTRLAKLQSVTDTVKTLATNYSKLVTAARSDPSQADKLNQARVAYETANRILIKYKARPEEIPDKTIEMLAPLIGQNESDEDIISGVTNPTTPVNAGTSPVKTEDPRKKTFVAAAMAKYGISQKDAEDSFDAYFAQVK